MLKHTDVWRAIDRLAREYGYSASGLARQSGLDPTTFNKSKRVTREGKLRWPSTESVSKVLAATGASLAEFVSFTSDGESAGVYRNIPLIGFVQAGASGLRVYLDNTSAIDSVATVLREAIRATKNGAKGPISFCLLNESLPGEVDMELGQNFPVTPQIKGALKSLEGVLMVEDL